MPELTPPDLFHASAASGWLDLGNCAEALLELERISPENRDHLEVLDVRWEALAQQKDWTGALRIAERIAEIFADRADGWIKRSFALHEMKRTEEAWNHLAAAAPRFPKESIIPYNLACYACQLGRPDEAFELLRHAFKLGTKSELKRMALDDPDLVPLADRIRAV